MSWRREPRVVAEGFAYLEAPRWHEGRLWCAHWGAGELLAVDPDGTWEVAAPGPSGMGWAADWLPDGRLLVTGETLVRREPDGTFVQHADLTGITGVAAGPTGSCDEIVVDGRGNAYVNSIELDFLGDDAGDAAGDGDAADGGVEVNPGVIALVRPDGTARRVAGGLAFPNGMAITPDGGTLVVAESFGGRLTAFDLDADGGLSHRRTWAEVDGYPDGICLDAEGAVWFADVPNRRCVRVHEGGLASDEVRFDRACFACALGGDDGRTLFVLAAEWDGAGDVEQALARRTGRIYAVDVEVPAAG